MASRDGAPTCHQLLQTPDLWPRSDRTAPHRQAEEARGLGQHPKGGVGARRRWAEVSAWKARESGTVGSEEEL